jgi:hypothetical protein
MYTIQICLLPVKGRISNHLLQKQQIIKQKEKMKTAFLAMATVIGALHHVPKSQTHHK